jgi:F-type H+-transporting ATPase subunit delta
MAELATIARPYAEALFKAVGAGSAQTWLDALAQVGTNAELIQFAADPKANRAQVFQVISNVLPEPLPERGANFLRTIIENDRLPALAEIAQQYRELSNAKTGVADALVESAFPLHGAALADLQPLLEAKFKRPLTLQVAVVPELIGGIRVTVGDEVYDTSVLARLEQMKMALTA